MHRQETLGVQFLQGKQFATFATSFKRDQGLTATDATITMWNWSTSLHGDCYRKLVNECRGVFMRLQDGVQSEKGEKKTKILTGSRSYRAVAQACILDMERTAVSLSGDAAQDVAGEMRLLAAQQLLWAIAETVFLLRPQKGYAVPSLLDVIRQHFPPLDGILDDVTTHGNRSEHYTTMLFHFLSLGQVDEARRLLALHELADTSEFVQLDTILKRMPVFARFSGHHCDEFTARWRYWQANVRDDLSSDHFRHELTVAVAQLLVGDQAALSNLRDMRVAYHWIMLLGAHLFWAVSPSAGLNDFAPAAQFALTEFGGVSQLASVDSLLLAALELDLPLILKDSSEVLNSWWFPAHFTDLCHHLGVLEPQIMSCGTDLREFLLAEYASCFLQHDSLWIVAIDYFSKCPVFGNERLQQCVERVPLNSEVKARKLLSVCQRHRLPETARDICRVMARRAKRQQRVGDALNWALKAKDPVLVGHFADIVLTDYNQRGEFSVADLIENLGNTALISESATFLSMYKEFHKRYGDGELQNAANLLLHLISSGIAPRRFWLTLLIDALPLLEGRQLLFDAGATYELLEALEQVESSQEERLTGEDETLLPEGQDADTRIVAPLRLALAWNLKRALLAQGRD